MSDFNIFSNEDDQQDAINHQSSDNVQKFASTPEYVTFEYDPDKNYPVYKDGKFFDKKKLLYSLRDAIKHVDWSKHDPNEEIAFKIKMQKAFSFATSDWLSGDDDGSEVVNENLDEPLIATESEIVYEDDDSNDETTQWV